jgi:hypothetical protein
MPRQGSRPPIPPDRDRALRWGGYPILRYDGVRFVRDVPETGVRAGDIGVVVDLMCSNWGKYLSLTVELPDDHPAEDLAPFVPPDSVEVVEPAEEKPEELKISRRERIARNKRVPTTLYECFEVLREDATAEELEEFRSMDEGDLIGLHLFTGMAMRIAWGLTIEEGPLWQDLQRRGLEDPDGMSVFIIEQFWRKLNGLPVFSNYEDSYRDHRRRYQEAESRRAKE